DGGVAASRAGERPAGAARSPPAQKKERKGPALTHGAFFYAISGFHRLKITCSTWYFHFSPLTRQYASVQDQANRCNLKKSLNGAAVDRVN
ncbi:hypothetical protein AAH450_21020, partial [Erwinia sp. P7711]|uniref:hypothetical protein n=1 Tax=Erwinia sp. P7711 TaxID=3141451 RepID=UPI003192AEC8